jgi:hypothetical protein
MERAAAGKWERQAVIAARTIRINESLRATDVDAQREADACLGTAVNLEIDAVRLVLTGQPDIARTYFDAIRKLSAAAIERRETWVFTDEYFARCEALRLRTVATWALGIEDQRDCAATLESWVVLARAGESADLSQRNAPAVFALLAAHCGDFARASAAAAPMTCNRPAAWCELLSLLKDLHSPDDDRQRRWSAFFERSVVSPVPNELVGTEFNAGEACMIANVLATVNGWRSEPFQTIRLLRDALPF